MNLYWFRNNLRLRDNPSLVKAINESESLIFIYILNDTLFGQHSLGFPVLGEHRRKHLFESIESLKKDFEKEGTQLHILKGDPIEVISDLIKNHSIETVYTSKEVGYNEQLEEEGISKIIPLKMEDDQSLFPETSLPFELNKLPSVFTSYRKKVEKGAILRDEANTISIQKTSPIIYLTTYHLSIIPVKEDSRKAFPYAGGEKEAWKRIEDYFWQSENLASYKETRNELIGEAYSSKLSPFLAVGSISPISIYHEVKKFETEVIANQSTYWLIFELLWRDFFRMTALKYGKELFLNGINGNTPYIQKNEKIFQQWIDGETDDDFVDANMKELKLTGFMSNRGRQNVASYLIHDLKQDWRWGAAYFESQLIDYDCSSNWGNWMYLAGIGNDPRNRKFNTQLQAERYDPDNKYAELWSNN